MTSAKIPTVTLSDIDTTTAAIRYYTPTCESHVSCGTDLLARATHRRSTTRVDVRRESTKVRISWEKNKSSPTRSASSSSPMKVVNRRDANHRRFVTPLGTHPAKCPREVRRCVTSDDATLAALYRNHLLYFRSSAFAFRLPPPPTAAAARNRDRPVRRHRGPAVIHKS